MRVRLSVFAAVEFWVTFRLEESGPVLFHLVIGFRLLFRVKGTELSIIGVVQSVFWKGVIFVGFTRVAVGFRGAWVGEQDFSVNTRGRRELKVVDKLLRRRRRSEGLPWASIDARVRRWENLAIFLRLGLLSGAISAIGEESVEESDDSPSVTIKLAMVIIVK